MKQQLNLLVRLQKIESDAALLRARKHDLPGKKEALMEEVATREACIQEEQDRLEYLRKEHRKKEADLTVGAERVKKAKNRLLEVKTNKEYEATLKEIDSIGDANGMVEEEIIVLLDEIDSLSNRIALEVSDVAALRQRNERETARIEEELAAIDLRLQDALREQDTVRNSLEAPLIRKFDLIRGRRNGQAVVVVRNEICDGCHMNIPPQMFNDLIRSETIQLCPHCNRIIYCEEPATEQ